MPLPQRYGLVILEGTPARSLQVAAVIASIMTRRSLPGGRSSESICFSARVSEEIETP